MPISALFLTLLLASPRAAALKVSPPAQGDSHDFRLDHHDQALAFLRTVVPERARREPELGSLWEIAQRTVLARILRIGGQLAQAGGRPTFVVDIHDTLENIDALGLRKRDAAVQATSAGPEFVRDALAQGIHVILLSNSEEWFRDREVDELRRLGYPTDDPHLTMMLKPAAKAVKWKDSWTWKAKAAKMIRAMGYQVIGHFDDKEKNLTAIGATFPDSRAFELTLDGPKAKPGSGSRYIKLRDFRH